MQLLHNPTKLLARKYENCQYSCSWCTNYFVHNLFRAEMQFLMDKLVLAWDNLTVYCSKSISYFSGIMSSPLGSKLISTTLFPSKRWARLSFLFKSWCVPFQKCKFVRTWGCVNNNTILIFGLRISLGPGCGYVSGTGFSKFKQCESEYCEFTDPWVFVLLRLALKTG